MVSKAVSSDDLEIPLISFSSFVSGDEATKYSTAQAILSGFQNAGFIYLKDHPIAKTAVQRTFEQSATFFKRPREQKEALNWTTPEANRGYSGPGREKVTNLTEREDIAKERDEQGADLKESYEIGRHNDPQHSNNWPDRFDQNGRTFKAHMIEFFEQCKQMHILLMRAIAVGLGIDEAWFDSFCDGESECAAARTDSL